VVVVVGFFVVLAGFETDLVGVRPELPPTVPPPIIPPPVGSCCACTTLIEKRMTADRQRNRKWGAVNIEFLLLQDSLAESEEFVVAIIVRNSATRKLKVASIHSSSSKLCDIVPT
jgi:hypothetical protein